MSVTKQRFCVLVLILLGAGQYSFAVPWEDPTLGNAVFQGPTEGHATSTYINPSAMYFIGPGLHLSWGSAARLDHYRFTSSDTTSSDSVITPNGLFSLNYGLKEGSFGLLLHAPFAERFSDGGHPFSYHAKGGHIYQGILTIGGSAKLLDRLVIGVSASLDVYTHLRINYDRDGALYDGTAGPRGTQSDCGGTPCGVGNLAALEEYQVSTSSNTAFRVGLSFGVMVNPWRKLWLSFAYNSAPGVIDTLAPNGSVTFTRADRDDGTIHHNSAEIRYRVPQSMWLGARWPLGDYAILANVHWVLTNLQRELDFSYYGNDLPEEIAPWQRRHRGLRDSWNFALGMERNFASGFRYGARFRVETGATAQDKATPFQMDTPSATLGLGVDLPLSTNWSLEAGLDSSWFMPADTSNSAFSQQEQIACADAKYSYDACEVFREGRGIPTFTSDINRFRNTLWLTLRWDSL